jgi:uncharacterized protein YecT (DUF1311 family)
MARLFILQLFAALIQVAPQLAWSAQVAIPTTANPQEVAKCNEAIAHLENSKDICRDPDVLILWHRLLLLAAKPNVDLLSQPGKLSFDIRTSADIPTGDPGKYLLSSAAGCRISRPNQPTRTDPDAIRYCLLDRLNAGTIDDFPANWFGVPDKYLKSPNWIYHDFRATTYPFAPHLVASHNEPLCNALEKALQRDFRAVHHQLRAGHFGGTSEPDIGAGSDRLSIAGAQWVKWDFENNPITIGDEGTIDTDREPLAGVLEFRHQDYLLRSEQLYDGGIIGHLLQVKAGRASAETCTIRVVPSIAPPANKDLAFPDVIAPPRAFLYFVQLINSLQGQAPDALVVPTSFLGPYSVAQALSRPWEALLSSPHGFEADPYMPSGLMTRYRLRLEGLRDVALHHMDLNLEVALPGATYALAGYYRTIYGVAANEALADAKIIIDNILTSSFSFDVPSAPYVVPPDGFSDERVRCHVSDFVNDSSVLRDVEIRATARQDRSPVPDVPTLVDLLHEALLAGVSPADLNGILDTGVELSGNHAHVHFGEEIEPALFFAIEHPQEVKTLLERGANPNETNAYGKTALMYAAQYDLLETASVLLSHGANASAKTNRYAPRTVLDYAAENASPELIALILAATPASASGGSDDVASFLRKNTRLSNAERQMSITEVARLATHPETPSFDCGQAGGLDKLICADEELRVKDRALAAAYSMAATSGDQDHVAEQRAWIKSRNTACKSSENANAIACLNAYYRARITELGFRLNLSTH